MTIIVVLPARNFLSRADPAMPMTAGRPGEMLRHDPEGTVDIMRAENLKVKEEMSGQKLSQPLRI